MTGTPEPERGGRIDAERVTAAAPMHVRFGDFMPALARMVSALCVALCVAAGASVVAQAQAPRKRLLVIGEEKGYRHGAVTHAMVTIARLGKETGLWDTVIRTDTEALTKAKLEYNAKNLNDFDAVVFYTGGTLEMDARSRPTSCPSSTTTARGSSASTARRSRSRSGPPTAR